MPVVANALLVLHILDLVVDRFGKAEIIARCVHPCPLERGERLWYEERGADGNLTFADPLLLRNLIVIALQSSQPAWAMRLRVLSRLCAEVRA